MRVYLAGNITEVTIEGARNWRQYATKRLTEKGLVVLDPIPETCDKSKEKRLSFTSNLGYDIYIGKYIVDKDLAMIDAATVLLVEMTNSTIAYRGTICEMVEAKNKGKIVVVWSEWAGSHPWLANYATIILPTLDDCITFITQNMCTEDQLGLIKD